MKKFLTIVALSCIAASSVYAGPQQEKMKACNADAAKQELKGDARKAFMKDCLSAKKEAINSQQNKMKTCNADATAKELKGDARKAFMKDCLSAK